MKGYILGVATSHVFDSCDFSCVAERTIGRCRTLLEGSEGGGVLINILWREGLLGYTIAVHVTVAVESNIGLDGCCLGINGFVVGDFWCGVHCCGRV